MFFMVSWDFQQQTCTTLKNTLIGVCEDAIEGDVIGEPGVIGEIDETHMVTAKQKSVAEI